MAAVPEAPILDMRTAQDWEAWLEAHYATTEAVWLRLSNKTDPDPGISYLEAVEGALCFGWIDGQMRGNDDISRLQRFTPRRARSVWSKINVERAERLVAEGRMRPAGLAEIERAKADGRWARAYDPSSTATVPDDFLAALAASPKAAEFFATLDKRNTYAVIHRLQTASTPALRTKRLRAMIERFERGERFHD